MKDARYLLFGLFLTGCSGCEKDAPCVDDDGDGFYTRAGCVDTAAGFLDEVDCDDADANVNPVEPDVLDALGTDQNCDGVDGVDQDGDACASDASGGGDCDDADSSVWGESCADEICDDDTVNLCATTEADAMRACGWGSDAGLGDADVRLEGENHGDVAGYSLTWAGDMNGDGFDDFAVGARGWEAGAYTGRVYLVSGGEERLTSGQLVSTATRILSSEEGGSFGHALAGPGDVDGDGYDDLLVGAPNRDTSSNDTGIDHGAIYVVPGGEGYPADLASAYYLKGTAGSTCRAGYTVAAAGDVDEDGLSDVLVGAPETTDDACAALEGSAWLVLGSELTACSKSDGGCILGDHTLLADDATGFGMGLASGDIDGDGALELLVGAAGTDGAGEIYLLEDVASSEGTTTATSSDLFSTGEEGSYLGGRLASGVDFDLDGYDDVVASAEGLDATTEGQGAVLILYGSPLGVVADVTTLLGEGSGTSPGTALSILDDADGDGRPDLAVGAPCVGDDSTTEGRECMGATYVIFGSEITPGIAELSAFTRFLGDSTPDQSGFAVSGEGDGDGDGASDLLIGAFGFDPVDDQPRGAAYLVYGGGY